MLPLLVSFIAAPGLAGPGVPATLLVRLTSLAPVTVELPVDDACFASQSMQLSLVSPGGQAIAQAPCAPGGKTRAVEVTPQKPHERTVPLATVFPGADWGRGTWRFEAGWLRTASQWSLAGDVLRRATPLGTVKVLRGQDAALPGGGSFRFDSHGHKRTREGETSPLLVQGAFALPGGKPHSISLSLEAGDKPFGVDGYVFQLVDATYGTSMTLRCWGVLEANGAPGR